MSVSGDEDHQHELALRQKISNDDEGGREPIPENVRGHDAGILELSHSATHKLS